MKYCPNCGKELQDDMQFCPSCGTQTPITDETIIAEEKPSKKKRKGIRIFFLLTAVILILFGTWFFYSDSVRVNTYNQFVNLYNTMSNCSVKAEQANVLTINVWKNSIFKTVDEQTDKYTKKSDGSGMFYDDFNDALSSLYADQSFADNLTEISDLQINAGVMLRDLAKHPKAFDVEYSDFKNCYNLFLKFTNLSLRPSGSLGSFTEDYNELDKELGDKLQELKIYFN